MYAYIQIKGFFDYHIFLEITRLEVYLIHYKFSNNTQSLVLFLK